MKELLRKGKFIDVAISSMSLPYEFEYEQLEKKLMENTYKKYNIPIDKRRCNNTKQIIMPRNEIMEYETDMFSPYPQDNIPYEESGSWIGGYDDQNF